MLQGAVFGKKRGFQGFFAFGTPVANPWQPFWRASMSTAPFFTTRLGRAALVSIAAMAAMNAGRLAPCPTFPT
jgi:hypothetical protein